MSRAKDIANLQLAAYIKGLNDQAWEDARMICPGCMRHYQLGDDHSRIDPETYWHISEVDHLPESRCLAAPIRRARPGAFEGR